MTLREEILNETKIISQGEVNSVNEVFDCLIR